MIIHTHIYYKEHSKLKRIFSYGGEERAEVEGDDMLRDAAINYFPLVFVMGLSLSLSLFLSSNLYLSSNNNKAEWVFAVCVSSLNWSMWFFVLYSILYLQMNEKRRQIGRSNKEIRSLHAGDNHAFFDLTWWNVKATPLVMLKLSKRLIYFHNSHIVLF